ncbi:MAG: 3-hydroxyacyl-CoA dehydrogenase NAD-binding domain-containing protein [Pirellulales bacterium]
MGYSIAAVNLKRGVKVILGDANDAAVVAGMRKAIDEAAYDKQTRKTDPTRAATLAAAIGAAQSNGDFSDCDLVIEAVIEKPDIKRQVLGELEAALRPDAFLASNTSTIRIAGLAEGLSRPRNFCGMHFFNPVRKMPLVEIIRGPLTSDETVVAAVAYAKRIGKTPIVVNDGPGFLVNRLLSPYLNEAMVLLHEGVHWSEIDAAAVAWGMPLGPFAIYDMVGTDTSLYAGRTMWEAFPERMILSSVLIKLMEAGRLGQKSGAGFYRYKPGDDRPLPDAAADDVVAPAIASARKKLRGIERPASEDVIWRLVLPMVLEATMVLEEGLVRRVEDVDLGVVLGLGFPAFRGGVLRWADEVGRRRFWNAWNVLRSTVRARARRRCWRRWRRREHGFIRLKAKAEYGRRPLAGRTNTA